MTKHDKNISFLIDHIDPLGQGVFKKEEDVFFIPKTLPGESGLANIHKSKKGVHFASIQSLENTSSKRINPECIHYNQCQGCHYLHCNYESELEFKRISFERMLSYTNFEGNPKVIDAPRRLNYRNRIQLHYHKKVKKLGFINSANKRIIEVQECQIASNLIKDKLSQLYSNNNWLSLVKKEPIKGHIELYEKGGVVEVHLNKKYAQGGFTQVFNEMNLKLIDMVSNLNQIGKNDILLDLFGGNGNLSQNLEAKKYILDFYTKPKVEEDFFHLDLFEEDAHKDFLAHSKVKKVDHFYIDPPRAGFKHISSWVEQFSPQTITYVSCHPQTMFRDIKALNDYKIKEAFMIDLFPSTFHFEACLYLEKI